MTVGTGIFLSTVLIVLALAVFQISKHGKWAMVAKWMIGLAAIVGLFALGLWRWNTYQQRPT